MPRSRVIPAVSASVRWPARQRRRPGCDQGELRPTPPRRRYACRSEMSCPVGRCPCMLASLTKPTVFWTERWKVKANSSRILRTRNGRPWCEHRRRASGGSRARWRATPRRNARTSTPHLRARSASFGSARAVDTSIERKSKASSRWRSRGDEGRWLGDQPLLGIEERLGWRARGRSAERMTSEANSSARVGRDS
jgi:hypothetical protein